MHGFPPLSFILGIIIAAVSSAFGSKFLIHSKAWYLYNPIRVICLLVYALFIFMWELIKANVSMAEIVLSPNLKNCRSGVIRIPGSDKIRSNYGLAMVANSITLTPGTITMNVAEDESGKNYYYIQWIDVAEKDRGKAGEIIKGRMERAIARIWK